MTQPRVLRRSFLAGCAATAAELWLGSARASDVAVPVTLQAELVAKVAAFDRNLRARAGDRVRLVVVHATGGDSARVGAEMASALEELHEVAGLPKTVEMLPFASAASCAAALRAARATIAYFSVDLESQASALAAGLAGADILTIGANGETAARGACVGFELEEGRPKLWVNVRCSRAQNVDFKADLLTLARLV